MRTNTMARFADYDDNPTYDYEFEYNATYGTTFDTYQQAAEFVANRDPDEFTQDGATVLYSRWDTDTQVDMEDEDTAFYYFECGIPRTIVVDGVDFDLLDTGLVDITEF